MWLLVVNGIVYVSLGILTGRFRAKLFPIRPREVLHDFLAALRGRLSHDDLSVYNAVQKLLYAGVILTGIVIVFSGLSIWKPVQFWWLTDFFGGFNTARYVHFAAMAAIVAFLTVHVTLAFIVPESLTAIVSSSLRITQSWTIFGSATSGSYVARHWRGELPLSVSYWINGVLIGGLARAILAVGLAEFVTAGPSPPGNLFFAPLISGVAASFVILYLLIYIWQIVGIWRSAARYQEKGGHGVWGVLARLTVVAGIIVSVFSIFA